MAAMGAVLRHNRGFAKLRFSLLSSNDSHGGVEESGTRGIRVSVRAHRMPANRAHRNNMVRAGGNGTHAHRHVKPCKHRFS